MSRQLDWDGCVNVRDLGGLPASGGARIREAALVRSDTVGRLTARGWEALVAHGVRTVLDLRWAAERVADPPRKVDVDVVHVSLLGDDEADYARGLYERLASIDDFAMRTVAAYTDMLETWQERFVRAVAAAADARPGAVLVHCSAGKDRTGLVVALLLGLAGVEPGVIAADYAATTPALPELHRRWIEDARDEREHAWRASKQVQSTPAEALAGVLEGLERRHGGIEAYARAGGLDDARLARLRERLLEHA